MYFLLGNLEHGAVLVLEACLEDEGPETYQCVAALWKKLGLPLWSALACVCRQWNFTEESSLCLTARSLYIGVNGGGRTSG